MPLIQNQNQRREIPPRVAAPGKENKEYDPLATALRPAYTYPNRITTPAKLLRRSRTQRRGRGRGRTQRRGRGRGRN